VRIHRPERCPPGHPGEHPLLARTLVGVRSPPARILCTGFDHVAELLEHVDEHVFE
jgi:hypothetical protein